jgi:hypothetical protein
LNQKGLRRRKQRKWGEKKKEQIKIKRAEQERLQEQPPANQGRTWWQNAVLLDEICWARTHIDQMQSRSGGFRSGFDGFFNSDRLLKWAGP